MKTRIFALLMALMMLLSFALVGCSDKGKDKDKGGKKANDQNNVTVNADTPVEYLEASIDASLEIADEQLKESQKDSRTTITIGNIIPLLELADVDTSSVPPLSDITLDMYSSYDKHNLLTASVMLGETPCDISAFITQDLDFILTSELVDGAYSITFDEIMALSGAELPFDISTYTKYNNAFMANLVMKYVESVYDLLLETASVDGKDNGDSVTVTLTFTPESATDFAVKFVEIIKNDQDFIDFLNFQAMTSMQGYEFTAEDFEFDSEELKKELTDAGFSADITFNVDKASLLATEIDINATVEEESLNIHITAPSENELKLTVSAPDMEEFVVCDMEYTDDSFFMDFVITMDDERITVNIDAKDGEVVASLNSGYSTVAVTGKYSISEKSFSFLLETVSVDGNVIDLTEAKIALATEIDVTIPALPTEHKPILELSESELSNIGLQLIINSGLMNYISLE